MTVHVIIPNWNGMDFIADALRSLESQSLKCHIVVVENGSTDGSTEFIAQKFPDVELLAFLDNAGFAGGVNRGIRPAITAGAKYVAIFNNDAQADKDWLRNLVAAAEAHPEAGVVTGKFMRMDRQHFDSTGDYLTTHAMPFPRGRNEVDTGQYDTGEHVFGATGGASLYRTKLLKQIGLFDEDFFAYFEDVDISFRAQLAGWKVWYEPTAISYHLVSGTSSRLGSFSRFHSIKNLTLLYTKNMPGYLFWRYKFWFFMRLLRMGIGAARDKQLLVYFKAVLAALRLLPSTLRKRRAIQKQRTVTIGYIQSILYPGAPPRIPKL